ncbi:hypothetical protein Tco_0721060 [Tanacetum coccineum]
MSEMCADIVSAVLLRLFFVFFIVPIGVVAATLGAVAGAVIGWSTNKTRLVQNVIIGAVSWTTLSYKLSKATFDYLISDGDHEHGLAIKLVKVIPGCPGFSKSLQVLKESIKTSLKKEMEKHKGTRAVNIQGTGLRNFLILFQAARKAKRQI